MEIVVFDATDWISALRFGGVPLMAIDHAFAVGSIASCDLIRIEVRIALSRKFGWTFDEVDIAMDRYLNDGVEVQIQGTIRGVCKDPNDDMLFECAVRSNASIIVSGDRRVRAVGTYRDFKL